jgi:hypothetical protein
MLINVVPDSFEFTAWPIVDGRSDALRARWGSIAKRRAVYLRLRKPAISIAGSEEGAARKPAISITGNKQGTHSQNQPFRFLWCVSSYRKAC